MTRAEELVHELVSDPKGRKSARRVQQLLEEYYRGVPLDSLRMLIHSQDETLQGDAAWIGSELPYSGRELLNDMTKLLSSGGRRARFYAIECIQLWSLPAVDAGPLSRAIGLVMDEDPAVRWKALCFLATADLEQLKAAARFLGEHESDCPYLASLRWLSQQETSASQVMDRIGSDDLYERRFAVVAAARLKDRELIALATKSADVEAAQFAKDMLELISIARGSRGGNG